MCKGPLGGREDRAGVKQYKSSDKDRVTRRQCKWRQTCQAEGGAGKAAGGLHALTSLLCTLSLLDQGGW